MHNDQGCVENALLAPDLVADIGGVGIRADGVGDNV